MHDPALPVQPERGLDGFVPMSTALELLPEMAFHRRTVHVRESGEWRPSPPSKIELDRILRTRSKRREGILMVIIAGRQRARALLHNSSLSDFCILPKVVCSAYTDTDDSFDAPPSMRVVPASAYLREPMLPPPKRRRECCPRTGKWAHAKGRQMTGNFFCDTHRAATLTSQYRFLPALGHARREHASSWALGDLSWLVMVDDDAIVNPIALRQVLEGLDPDVPAYLGDFGEWTYALAASPVYRNSSSQTSDLTWEPPYACGGAGTLFSRAAVRKLDFFRCAARYHIGCFQSDWMIGRCAAESRVLPMVSTLSCGLCLTCTLFAHTQRRRALARLRDESSPPCFALTTCDHHLPVPLRRELCHLLPRRTPIMHGWERMCADALSGPAYPRVITEHVSSRTPVTAALRAMNAPNRIANGLRSLGVVQLEDLMDLRSQDLAGLGMSTRQQSRFMRKLWDGGPIRTSMDVAGDAEKIRVSTPLRTIVDMLRLHDFRSELRVMGVQTAGDLSRLTEQQLVGMNMSHLQRRRVEVASQRARSSSDSPVVAPKISIRALLDSIRKSSPPASLQKQSEPPPEQSKKPPTQSTPPLQSEPPSGTQVLSSAKLVSEPPSGTQVPSSAKMAHSAPQCDCSWTRGPMCRGQKDDFTLCWAACCPKRAPRFGDWNLTRATVRMQRLQLRKRGQLSDETVRLV